MIDSRTDNRFDLMFGLPGESVVSVPLIEIDPKMISLLPVNTTTISDLQHKSSKAVWRPAPGRKLGFLVAHGETTIGILFLSSPVINLGCRDKFLNMGGDPSERGRLLRHYMDMSVCVGFQPLAWYWNIGKLIAMVATSKEVADIFYDRYEDSLTGIITTSLYGPSSQYNRIYRKLGYTEGFGHEHISDDEYDGMLDWMKENGVDIPKSNFGAGSNPRMRRIGAYFRARGMKVNLKHGKKRGVYYHACEGKWLDEIISDWYERWGLPRYLKNKDLTPPYYNGLEGANGGTRGD